VHSVSNILRLACTSTIEVDMVSWCALNKHTHTRQSNKQTKMEDCFRSTWCHLDIFSSGDGAISWCLLPSLYLDLGSEFVVMGLLPPNSLRFLQRRTEENPTRCFGADLHKGRLGLAEVPSFPQKSSS